MKVGDMIKVDTGSHLINRYRAVGVIVRIGVRHNDRRVATVLTARGLETWPLDSYYEYEVIHEAG